MLVIEFVKLDFWFNFYFIYVHLNLISQFTHGSNILYIKNIFLFFFLFVVSCTFKVHKPKLIDQLLIIINNLRSIFVTP